MRASGPLTLGQRTLRLTASAAMCGVALSYLVGGQISDSIQATLNDSTASITLSALTPYERLGTWAATIDWSKQFAAPEPSFEPEEEQIIVEIPAAASPAVRIAARTPRLPMSRPPHTVIRDSIRVRASKLVRAKQVVAAVPALSATTQNLGFDQDTQFSASLQAAEFPELYELLLRDRLAFHRLVPIKTMDTQAEQVAAANIEDAPANKESVLAVKEAIIEAKPAEGVTTQQEERIIASQINILPRPEPKAPTPVVERATPSDFTVVAVPAAVAAQPPKLTANAVVVSTQSAQPKATSPPNIKIKGSISGALEDYPGHFEIGLYGASGSDGKPVGAPLAWSSLRAAEHEFVLDMNIQKNTQDGYLFLHYIAKEGAGDRWFASQLNPLPLHKRAGIYYAFNLPNQDSVSLGRMAAMSRTTTAEPNTRVVGGKIFTMFSRSPDGNPVAGALIRLRGTKLETNADASGVFRLEVPGGAKKIQLEISRAGYAPSIFSVNSKTNTDTHYELLSKQLLDNMAIRVGLRQGSFESAMIVKIKNANGEGLPGYAAQLSQRADGPYYFDKDGNLSRSSDLKSTGFDGRLVFFNIPPGSASLELSNMGAELFAPVPLTAVEGGELLSLELEPIAAKFDGRVLDASHAAAAVIAGARVRVEGSSDWSTTDNGGNFVLPQTRFFKDQILNLEVNHSDFYAHLYTMSAPGRDGNYSKNLYAFPLKYINQLAARGDVELDPQAGIVVGSLGSGYKVRVDALSDLNGANLAKDFYFDKKQDLVGSHAFSDTQYGTFIIFNTPRGRTMLHGYDGAASLKYSNTVYTAPSAISVVLPE